MPAPHLPDANVGTVFASALQHGFQLNRIQPSDQQTMSIQSWHCRPGHLHSGKQLSSCPLHFCSLNPKQQMTALPRQAPWPALPVCSKHKLTITPSCSLSTKLTIQLPILLLHDTSTVTSAVRGLRESVLVPSSYQNKARAYIGPAMQTQTTCVCLPGGSRGQGQSAQPSRHSSAEGPWQPEDAETQREFMRQRAVQRAQVHYSSIYVI